MDERFAILADELIAQVRAAKLGPTTEVFLVQHCVNQDGVLVEPVRTTISPAISVTFPGNQVLAWQFAAEEFRNTIIGNINSLVRYAPTGLHMISGGPNFPVAVRDFSLEIVQPTDQPESTTLSTSRGFALRTDLPPLRVDEGGAVRVGSSRVGLDLVVEQYENGMTPEDMVRAYDTLNLADVYGAIAYYLRHRDEVGAYLKRREGEAQALQSKIESARPRIGREELLARRGLREEDHAPAGQ